MRSHIADLLSAARYTPPGQLITPRQDHIYPARFRRHRPRMNVQRSIDFGTFTSDIHRVLLATKEYSLLNPVKKAILAQKWGGGIWAHIPRAGVGVGRDGLRTSNS